ANSLTKSVRPAFQLFPCTQSGQEMVYAGSVKHCSWSIHGWLAKGEFSSLAIVIESSVPVPSLEPRPRLIDAWPAPPVKQFSQSGEQRNDSSGWLVMVKGIGGGTVTSTSNDVAAAALPAASCALQSTVVEPTEKVDPDAGAQITSTFVSTLSVAMGLS